MIVAKPRILTVFGTRPEAIKLAPLVKLLQSCPLVESQTCVTGQHRAMLDQVLELFQIAPEHDLNLMQPAQDLGELTGRVVTRTAEVIRQFRPDWVIVQGDTTTAFAVSLAAYYEKIAVAHVEAGLRTGNIYSPFPEEMNRRLVSCIADLHFAPTLRARDNLLAEGFSGGKVFVTGNSVVDALYWVRDRIQHDAATRQALAERFAFLDRGRKLVLMTGHRRESFGEPFANICHAIVDMVSGNPSCELIYPVHLNPQVQDPVMRILGDAPAAVAARIHLIPPVDYLSFVYLMERARLIITDSGGVQEEAPSFQKPVLVTRETTERPEAIEAGVARLVGADRKCIAREAQRLLQSEDALSGMPPIANPYGDGRTCARILQRLLEKSGAPFSQIPDFQTVDTRLHAAE